MNKTPIIIRKFPIIIRIFTFLFFVIATLILTVGILYYTRFKDMIEPLLLIELYIVIHILLGPLDWYLLYKLYLKIRRL